MLLELFLGILGSLVGNEVQSRLGELKYKMRLDSRIKAIESQVFNTHGSDGIAFLTQAAECIHKSGLNNYSFIQARLDKTLLLDLLRHSPAYVSLIRSIVGIDKISFDNMCLQILGIICEEMVYLPTTQVEMIAETLRDTKTLSSKFDVFGQKIDDVLQQIPDKVNIERCQRNAEIFRNEIHEMMSQYEYRKAVDHVDKLKDWLLDHEKYLQQAIISELYELIVEAEITRAKLKARFAKKADLSIANEFIRKAKIIEIDSYRKSSNNLLALEAYVISIEYGADEGLNRLNGRSDPDSLRRRLKILADAKRYSEAVNLVPDGIPEQRWCEQAVLVLAADGGADKARNIMKWAESLPDSVTRRRCILALAEGLFVYAIQDHENSPILPGDLTPNEQIKLQDVLNALHTITSIVAINGRIESELEYVAESIALQASYLMGDQVLSTMMAKHISVYKPGSYELGQLTLHRWIEADEDLPRKLREEYPISFHVRVMAAQIEGDLLGEYDKAFDEAMKLANEADNTEDRKAMVAMLHEFAQHLGTDKLSEVRQIAPTLLTNDTRFLFLLEAIDLLRNGDTVSAGNILEANRDESDTFWLQIYANYLLQNGDGNSATDYLVKATKLLTDPDLLRKTAEFAYRFKRIDDSIKCLERLVKLDPGDVVYRSRLAFLYLEKQEYLAAAGEFEVLSIREPAHAHHVINQAVCLALSGNADAALKVYDGICLSENPPLTAILGRSQILRSLGRVNDAFASLQSVKDLFWDDASFLIQFQDIAFSAQKESAGHDAFMHLKQLQNEGRTEKEYLQTIEMNQLIDDMKSWRKRDDDNHLLVVNGKMPWLLADTLGGSVPYWGWLVRTQPMDYIYDAPLHNEHYCIYSTNGFSTRVNADGEAVLRPLSCPPPGTEVVIDQSSLITLHNLGLLEKAATYFGKIIIPAPYLSQVLSESSRLVLHQLSLRSSLQEIKTALDDGILSVLPDNSKTAKKPIPYVNEHTVDGEVVTHYYRIKDIIEALHEDGYINDQERDRMATVAHKPLGADSIYPKLRTGQELVIDLSTIRTLSSINALDTILRRFSVYINIDDKSEVTTQLKTIAAQEEVRTQHLRLWDVVRDDNRFVQSTYVIPQDLNIQQGNQEQNTEHDGEFTPVDISIASCVLAIQIGVPLLADDRFAQSYILNNRRNIDQYASFGTNDLIVAMAKAGLINEEESAKSVKQLIDWRYRFIIISPTMLRTLATGFDGSVSAIPGQPLRDVARYVHDCMQDAGLFGGLEPTDPPTSMAITLFMAWLDNVVEFVVDVWSDIQLSTGSAIAYTQWAISELLPSLPRNLPEPGRSRVASYIQRMVLGKVMLAIPRTVETKRANTCLTTIAKMFGLDEREYLNVVIGVINDTQL